MSKCYTIEARDFGPIVEASVEMRPLTVFIGPSNTGKSYLAVLLYALHRCLGDSELDYHNYREIPWSRSIAESSQSVQASFPEWFRQLWKGDTRSALPDDFSRYICATLERADGLQKAIAAEVNRCFGIDDPSELARGAGSSGSPRVGFRVPQGTSTESVHYSFPLVSGHRTSASAVANLPALDERLRDMVRRDDLRTRLIFDGDSDFVFQYFMESLVGDLFRSLLGPLGGAAYYLPADRTGVMHSHKVVVGALLQGAASAGLRPPTNIPMLSGVLADFLEQLIAVSGPRRGVARGRKRDVELASALENNVLQGAIRVDTGDAGYPTFAYRPKNWQRDLPLMRSSSMVSELAPVVLYLRHLVQPGDVLIIEEPEAHLHPAMQAALARELARLVRAGVRVVMTTHSEWLLEQVGNLVRLSSLTADKQAEIGGADVALSPKDVGAWFFKPMGRPKGSIVEEVNLDPETGLFPTDYEAVSETLYNESAHIFNRMQEGSGE